MRNVLFLLLLLAAPGAVQAQEPEAPITVTVKGVGKICKWVALRASTKGEVVLWRALDPGLCFLDADLAPQDTRVTGVTAERPGKYRVLAITAVAGKPAVAEVTVEFVGPDPGPKPPEPKPPEPPDPKPPEPKPPVDQLVARLQAAYTADTADPKAKLKQRDALVGLYAAMVDHAGDKATVATVGDLKSDLDRTATALLSKTILVECRKIIASELAAVLPNDGNTQLNTELRGRAVAAFDRISKAMAKVQ